MLGWGALLFVVVVVLANRWVINSTDGYLYTDATLLPENDTGLVLGCSPFAPGGGASLQFRGRMQAAADLYKLGKVHHLILSGANPDSHYNEPKKMRDALLALGVPSEAMVLDYAGDNTFDSVARAQIVYGLDRLTVITQRYHGWRALFLARKMGVHAVAFAAPLADNAGMGQRNPPREIFARVGALLDLFVLQTEPRARSEVGPQQ